MSKDECLTCTVKICSGAGKPKSDKPVNCFKVYHDDFIVDHSLDIVATNCIGRFLEND